MNSTLVGRFQGRLSPEGPSRQTHPIHRCDIVRPALSRIVSSLFYVPTQAKAQVFLSLPNSNDKDTTSSKSIADSTNVSRYLYGQTRLTSEGVILFYILVKKSRTIRLP